MGTDCNWRQFLYSIRATIHESISFDIYLLAFLQKSGTNRIMKIVANGNMYDGKS